MADSPLPPLNWLRAFEASARHLSFTAAGEELHLTQSAVSQHIRNLEQFLGQDLFIRRTRALQLTEAGFNYLPAVREAFDILAAGTRAFVGEDRGQIVRVQCNLAFSTFWLAPALGELLRAYPWLTLNLATPIWDPERTAGNAEVEIRFGRGSEIPAAALRLSDDHGYPVCHPDFADGAPDWQRDILFDCAGVMGNWEAWLAGQAQRLPKGKLVHLSSTFVISLTAALHGTGLAMAHDTLAARHLENGDLVRPFDFAIEMPEAYFLDIPAKHNETPATRAFTTWIRERFGR